jgi:hypothetical protein
MPGTPWTVPLEPLRQPGRVLLSGSLGLDEVCFVAGGQLRLSPAEIARRPSDSQSFTGPPLGEVGLELRAIGEQNQPLMRYISAATWSLALAASGSGG